jgi:hypothetical protein
MHKTAIANWCDQELLKPIFAFVGFRSPAMPHKPGGIPVASPLKIKSNHVRFGEKPKMNRQVLQFVAVTSGGRAFDIDFPLHPQTQSALGVSDLVTRLLAAISEHAKGRADVSDGDILQALAMTSAIRGRMLDGDQNQIADLNRQLYDRAWEAVSAAQSYPAARA